MNSRNYALLGIIAPILGYFFIGASIARSPWFRWESNALSDLGHSLHSSTASIYNFGLLLTGLLIFVYAILSLRYFAKWTSLSIAFSAFALQLVGTFDEVYGPLHYTVSVLFFVSIGIASLTYAVEKKSYLGVIALLVGLSSWVLYWVGIYSSGVAVPETVSTLVILPWVMSTAIRVYRSSDK